MTRVAMVVLALAAPLVGVARADGGDGVGGARIVGTSCRDQFESRVVAKGSAKVVVKENHALDSRFVHLEVVVTQASPKTRHYDVRWALAPGVRLCRSRAKIGNADGVAIKTTSGAFSLDAPNDDAVRIELRGSIKARPRLRPELGPAGTRALVAGWAARSCAVRASDPAAAALLADMVERGHGKGCHGPSRRGVPPAAGLLKHLTAVFNAARTASDATGVEYYRVLAQLATGVPELPAEAGPAR